MTFEGLFDLSEWITSGRGQAHFYAALAALALGPFIFLRKKGDFIHRVGGYAYIASMVFVNISALAMYEIGGAPNIFHVFAVFSLASVVPGYLAARGARLSGGARPAIVGHMTAMAWSYGGLFMAGASQIVTRVYRDVIETWSDVYVALSIVIVLGSAATYGLVRANRKRLADLYGSA